MANPLKVGKAESGCGQSSKGGQGGEWVWKILYVLGLLNAVPYYS